MRRVVEFTLAALMLLAASPLLVLGAVAVLVSSGRPVFFGHERVGLGGRRFRCWKLRTMHLGAERHLAEDGALAARHREHGFKLPTEHDPRVTDVGRWLRRAYVDEIPQLFNVLNGSMALVGPRPVVPDELAEFEPYSDELLSTKPGVFGAWTAEGHERPPYPERVEMELDYVRRRSITRDFQILLRSIPVVFRGEGDGR